MPQLDISRCSGLTPAVLFNLILLTGVLEEPDPGTGTGAGAIGVVRTSAKARNNSQSYLEAGARSEIEHRLDEDIARVMLQEDGTGRSRQHAEKFYHLI